MGLVPPVTVISIAPLFPPLHETLIIENVEITGLLAEDTTTAVDFVQLLPSVTVTVYVAGLNDPIVDVVPPLLHK